MTAALEGGERSAAGPGRTLHSGKTRYPFYRRLGGPGRAENLVPTGIRCRTVQPVVSRYTDWATQPTLSFHLSLGVSSGLFLSGFLTTNLQVFLSSPKVYVLHGPSSISSPLTQHNILGYLETMFPLNVRDQFYHPHKTTGEIVSPCILISLFLYNRRDILRYKHMPGGNAITLSDLEQVLVFGVFV